MLTLGILQKLEFRILEMKDRRKQTDASFKDQIGYQAQKQSIVRGFSALELENMLKSSTKSAAKDVMTCLFIDNNGILSLIIK